MFKKNKNKILAILMIILTMFSSFQNLVFAQTEISSANLYKVQDSELHLQYWNSDMGMWYYVTNAFIGYNYNGKTYPAYCMNREFGGVDEYGDYTVSITDILSDVRIWRAITVGYPYRTPAQMGVANDLDAYVATKQAVYSILYGRDVRSFYRGGDSRGDSIVNAMEYMVNEGRYGTRTPQSANVTLNKIGGFVEEGNYYSQTYSVTAVVNIANYTVTNTVNMPSGGYIADINNNPKTSFNGNERFKVLIPKSRLVSDINTTITVQSSCETYPIFYGNAPVWNYQNYAVTFDPFGDEQGVTTFSLKTNTGKLQILKVDEETNVGLGGVTFELKTTSGTVVATGTTNSSGVLTFSNLYQGSYILREVATDEHYILNTSDFNVSIEYNKTTSLTVTNKHKKGNLLITKVDLDDPSISLGAVEFDLLESNGTFIRKLVTDVNGEIYLKNINIGNYILKETLTNKMYELSVDVGTTVNWNQTTNLTVTNEKKKGQIRIIKVDKDDNEVKIAGVKFEVLDNKDRILETITTDSNGVAISSRLPLGDYKVREKETLDYYILNEETKTITVERNTIKDITFENEKKKGQIEITKVDLDNNSILIEGVKFNVIDNATNKVVDTITTNAEGKATTKLIPINTTYTIEEIETHYKYDLNLDTYEANVKWKETTKVTITNEKKKGQIRIIKVDLDDNEIRIAGVKFEVLDKDKNVLETLITDVNGEATSSRLPSVEETYYIKEIETLENYVLNDELQVMTIENDKINDITIQNEKIKGQIQITKISAEDNEYSELEKGSLLENAIFEIYNDKKELMQTITTNDEGIAISDILLKGKYYIKEISAPKYYILNTDIFETEIKQHKEIVNTTVENDNVKLDVEVFKSGFIETQSKDTIYYNFKDIRNKSNVYLDNFTWQDSLPTNALRIEKIYTGTWNQDLKYSIWYKTNMNDYKVFKEDLSTNTNYEVDFTKAELQEGEYITKYEFRFNRVDVGFAEVDSPILYCKMLEGLGNGFIFTNNTKVSGTYFEKYVEDVDDWHTITYYKDIIVLDKLPRTGF